MHFLACESEARKVDLGVKNKWGHDWLQTEDNLKRKYAIWAGKVDREQPSASSNREACVPLETGEAFSRPALKRKATTGDFFSKLQKVQ